MKETALTQKHIELGAKMAPFAGYNMPVSYKGIIAEHNCVRNGVGIFDVSHMGEFIISGKEALNLLQQISSNDASLLIPGKVQYSCFPNHNGGIVDDYLLYKLNHDSYMLVVNASNIDKDWNWIKEYNTMGATISDISGETTLLAVQGPKATDALSPLTDIDLASMKYYTFKKGTFAGIDDVLVSATGYTGAGGFEIYFRNEHAIYIWNQIFEAGAGFGIQPIGLGARDTLRLEMGYCLYGNDIDENTSPIEAGLSWITKLNGRSFNSSEIFVKQKEQGVDKKLIGFEMLEKGIPRQGYKIKDGDGNVIGYVTSGSQSPSLQKAIGLGYVTNKMDQEIFIEIRTKLLKAVIVKPPFYKSNL